MLCLRTAAPKPCTKASILENLKIEMCSRFLAAYLTATDQKLQTLQKTKNLTNQYSVKTALISVS